MAQRGLGRRGDRAVGPLDDDAGPHAVDVLVGDDPLDGRRDEQVDRFGEHVGRGDGIRVGEPDDAARAIDVSGERGEVEAVTGTDSPAHVGDGDHAHSRPRQLESRSAPHLAEAVHGGRGLARIDARALQRQQGDGCHAERRRRGPALRAAERERLAVTVPHPALVAGAASIIQAISAAPEPTSGAGMSRSAPVMGATARA